MNEALELAKYLREVNDERKDLTNSGFKSIVSKIDSSSLKDDKVLLVYEPEVHESVAGIIAGRIKERYNKPTIVLTRVRMESRALVAPLKNIIYLRNFQNARI